MRAQRYMFHALYYPLQNFKIKLSALFLNNPAVIFFNTPCQFRHSEERDSTAIEICIPELFEMK